MSMGKSNPGQAGQISAGQIEQIFNDEFQKATQYQNQQDAQMRQSGAGLVGSNPALAQAAGAFRGSGVVGPGGSNPMTAMPQAASSPVPGNAMQQQSAPAGMNPTATQTGLPQSQGQSATANMSPMQQALFLAGQKMQAKPQTPPGATIAPPLGTQLSGSATAAGGLTPPPVG